MIEITVFLGELYLLSLLFFNYSLLAYPHTSQILMPHQFVVFPKGIIPRAMAIKLGLSEVIRLGL